MRTTLTIDDDVLETARVMADQGGESIGKVISALARRTLQASRDYVVMHDGLPVLPGREGAPPVTLELVNRLRDEGV